MKKRPAVNGQGCSLRARFRSLLTDRIVHLTAGLNLYIRSRIDTAICFLAIRFFRSLCRKRRSTVVHLSARLLLYIRPDIGAPGLRMGLR